MTTVHMICGIAVVAVNLAAAATGALAWQRMEPNRLFWPLLRAGQTLIVVQAALGFVLLSTGREPSTLHLIYGLVPLGVAFLGEQLRVASAQTVLDQRGLEDSRAVARLPEAEQRVLVLEIVRREIGVMAVSAAIIVILALRAGGWL